MPNVSEVLGQGGQEPWLASEVFNENSKGQTVSKMLGEANLCLWVLMLRINLQRALL